MESNISNEKEKLITEMEIKKESLGNQLKRYLEEVKKNSNIYIKEKTPFERLLQMVPANVELS